MTVFVLIMESKRASVSLNCKELKQNAEVLN